MTELISEGPVFQFVVTETVDSETELDSVHKYEVIILNQFGSKTFHEIHQELYGEPALRLTENDIRQIKRHLMLENGALNPWIGNLLWPAFVFFGFDFMVGARICVRKGYNDQWKDRDYDPDLTVPVNTVAIRRIT